MKWSTYSYHSSTADLADGKETMSPCGARLELNSTGLIKKKTKLGYRIDQPLYL